MTRTFPTGTPEHHLFYDAGASAIRATIVSFETINVKDGLKPHDATQLTVQGLGWSEAVGGLTLDLRLRNLLEKQFTQGDVQANDRALTKLLKEANRVKHILSANTEAMSRVSRLPWPLVPRSCTDGFVAPFRLKTSYPMLISKAKSPGMSSRRPAQTSPTPSHHLSLKLSNLLI